MATNDKDTIYVDIDDEITGIIDKLKSSNSKLVALVLPKRASVFQSIVNMKLLKRAADEANKNLVLITSEAGLLPLAGAASIHVAKTLNSKPEIPLAPTAIGDMVETSAEPAVLADQEDQPLDSTQPVGRLAGDIPAATKEPLETVDFDNEDKEEENPRADTAKEAAAAGAVAKKNKKLKVPNFNKFRLLLGVIVLLIILLLLGFFLLNKSLAKATINIKTNATNVPTSLNLTLSTTASYVDSASGVIPAKLDQMQKTYSQQVPTTGQKNEGAKATGSATISAEACNTAPGQPPADVPAGTGLSANGLTYITQQDTSFSQNPSNYDFQNHCFVFQANNPTPITAQSGGSSYNVSGVPFTVAANDPPYSYSANGSASGGTDQIVQVVNQNDINNAKSKININSNGEKQALIDQLKSQGYFAIAATYNSSTPNVSTSSDVGQAANNVTVTETISYSMFGVYQKDLETLVNNSVDSQINTAKQSILSDGLASANFSVTGNTAGNSEQLTMNTTAIAGPQLDIKAIKQAAEGKKAGDVKNQIMNNPNVTAVSVHFSPFWVTTVPSNINKITVKIAKPTNT